MTFSIDISNFVEKAKENNDTLVRKTVLDIGARLVERTPVGDTEYWASLNPRSNIKTHKVEYARKPPPGYVGGHARANWSHSEGARVVKEFKAIDASDGDDNVSYRRIADSCKRAGAAGKVHFIQNSVPYIERLEDGWSRQSPNGMVAVTQAEFQNIVDTNARDINK